METIKINLDKKIPKEIIKDFSINMSPWDFVCLENNEIHIGSLFDKPKYIIIFDYKSFQEMQWIFQTLNIFAKYLYSEIWVQKKIMTICFSKDLHIVYICNTDIE